MPRDNRFIWCMFLNVCCSDCVGVCGNVCCVAAIVKDSGFLSLRVLKYIVCLCKAVVLTFLLPRTGKHNLL